MFDFEWRPKYDQMAFGCLGWDVLVVVVVVVVQDAGLRVLRMRMRSQVEDQSSSPGSQVTVFATWMAASMAAFPAQGALSTEWLVAANDQLQFLAWQQADLADICIS